MKNFLIIIVELVMACLTVSAGTNDPIDRVLKRMKYNPDSLWAEGTITVSLAANASPETVIDLALKERWKHYEWAMSYDVLEVRSLTYLSYATNLTAALIRFTNGPFKTQTRMATISSNYTGSMVLMFKYEYFTPLTNGLWSVRFWKIPPEQTPQIIIIEEKGTNRVPKDSWTTFENDYFTSEAFIYRLSENANISNMDCAWLVVSNDDQEIVLKRNHR